MAEKASLTEESWEKIGGVRIRRPNTELQKPYVVQGDNSSIYSGEGALAVDSEQEAPVVEKEVLPIGWL